MKDYISLSREHFNKQAPEYDSNTSVFYSRYPKISCHDVADRLRGMTYASLLDIGCGTGYFIDLLASSYPAKYVGLDLSEKMLEVARAKQICGATFTLGLADDLPYRDETFDIVTCIQSFHHYPRQDLAMQEARRVLKPGGLYILSDTGVGGLSGWVYNHILFKLAKSGDYRSANRRAITRQMASNGFTVVESVAIRRFLYTIIGQKPH
ncbi:MAG: class I SAM-dependent methyltransferase [Actinomycetaceae bacterium]|nr:class I SAM-dependent methyltransferase [Actinomycetaceae bacterium]